jgi:hypothetical protein
MNIKPNVPNERTNNSMSRMVTVLGISSWLFFFEKRNSF